MASINPESPPMVPDLQKDSDVDRKKPANYMAVLNVVLRVLLFSTTLISVVALVTGKQTETIAIPFPPFRVSVSAQFTDSSAFIYSSAALSVACLYSIITTVLSFFALMKRGGKLTKLMSNAVFVIDVVLLGIVASATGAEAELGYIGLKGNSKMGSHKICNVYGSYCRHIGISVLSSSFASMVLCFLVVLRVKSLSRKNRQ
ncbi:hypothetical protein AgCh_002679 [Apium graveolens]